MKFAPASATALCLSFDPQNASAGTSDHISHTRPAKAHEAALQFHSAQIEPERQDVVGGEQVLDCTLHRGFSLGLPSHAPLVALYNSPPAMVRI